MKLYEIDMNAVKILKLLQQKGFASYLVGGCVRNMLTKRQSDNFDIATSAKPSEVEKILKQVRLPCKTVGKKYGTILVPLKKPIEVTTFRIENRYSDRRHPDKVRFTIDYQLDAKRRDFTINALYFDPIKKEIYDPTNGIKDLKLKVLRFVGDPIHRIGEDPLRMLRAIRISTQLGFKLEKHTFAAIKTRAKYIQTVSGERIKAELDKILLSRSRVEGLRLLDKSGLLRIIIPEVEPLKIFSHQSKEYHLEGNMFSHTLLSLEKANSANLKVLYALLFHDIGKPKTAQKVLKKEGWVLSTRGHVQISAGIFGEFAQRLKFSRQDRDWIEWLILNHEVRRFLKLEQKEQVALALNPKFAALLEVWDADFAGNVRAKADDVYTKLIRNGQKLGLKLLQKVNSKSYLIKKLVRGDLIMKYANLKPSRKLGKKILDVKTQIILGRIRSKTDLKNFLQKKS